MRMIRVLLAGTAFLAVQGVALAQQAGLGNSGWGASNVRWSGIYAGLQTGFASQKSITSTLHPGFFATNTSSSSELILGAHAGANGQIGMIVFGLEGDFERTGTAKSFRTAIAAGQYTGSVSAPWVVTMRGRAGVSFDRFLVYGTAGM
ncbi:MAG: outer membrane protein, partial [Beijerinckiaceae bacterium]